MKKIILIEKFFFIFAILSFCLISSASAQLVRNGGFEESSPGVVSGTDVKGWVLSLDAGSANFSIVDDIVYTGQRALKITINSVGSNQWDIQAVADSIPIVPGHTYRYSIWARADNPGAQVNFTVGKYNYNEYKAIRPANLTTTWQEFSMEFTVNDQERYARAPIHFSYSGNVGKTIYIDKLKIVNLNQVNKPVTVEAESGTLGSGFVTGTEGSLTYITNQQNQGGDFPENSNRVATYQVTFPDSGKYNLFVKVKVGSGGFNDDSFFYGNGFGIKPLDAASWIRVNGLAAAGYTDTNAIVNEMGGAGSNVWKWVRLSQIKNDGQGWEEGPLFIVSDDSLTQTFQLGGREDGLFIDKIAFGNATLFFRVTNLENGTDGFLEGAPPVWPGPPLAHKHRKFVGNVYSASQKLNLEAYWNQVTPENAGKWGAVEGTRNVMNWTELDSAYALAKRNNFPFRFHVLIWGNQQPTWIETLPPSEQLAEIREWFQAVANRYPAIDYLEVVNEPLHDPPAGTGNGNYINALGGSGTTGWDWIINAFKMAREIFPRTTKLVLNDYSIINSSTSTTNYLTIINLLKADTLIDVIAEQAHAFTTRNASVATMKSNLDLLASTGLPIQITEMDIDGATDLEQLNEYKRVFPLLYQHPAVNGITLWGWRPGLWRNDQKAYIINQDGSERPALQWLRTYLDTVKISTSDVRATESIPERFALYNNYPNPFNPSTQIAYSIPKSAYITLKVYNMLGQEVATLFDGVQQAGNHVTTFNASGLTSGVYFYRLTSGDYIETKKLVLMK